MSRSSHPRRLAAVAVLTCLLALGCAAGVALAAQGVSDATALSGKPAPGGAAACRALASRKASGVAAAGARAARVRRVHSRVYRRCANRLRRQAKRQRASASALPTQVPGNLVIGIDGGYASWSKSETEERAQLGAAVTRHEFDPTETVNAQDGAVQVAAETIHTRIHALLGGNQLGDAGHYREWVLGFVRRYGLGGSFWKEHPQLSEASYAITSIELGNEPYFGEMSPTQYAETVRPTLEEISNLHLPVQVVLPNRVYGNDTSWMDTLYQKIPNLNAYFYAFADHPYWYGHDPAEGGPAGPFARLETMRRRMNELGANTKPIFITEYGESTASCGSECVSEAVQAQHLSEMLTAVLAHPEWGVKMLSFFQLQDRGTASGDRELQFGLLRQDGSAKPSYAIVHGAMQQYRG
jgi:Glycosyl hydrolase catalytic core